MKHLFQETFLECFILGKKGKKHFYYLAQKLLPFPWYMEVPMEFNFVRHLLRRCLLIALSLRYRIKITGLKEIQDAHPELKGALILPNHPAQVDPILINCITGKVFNAQTLMSESYFYVPVLKHFYRFMRLFPCPDFEKGGTSYKKYQWKCLLHDMLQGLALGQNYIIYPSGRLMRKTPELMGGAFGVYDMLKRRPNTPVILIRTKGLWGSRFSWAGPAGVRPKLINGIISGLKDIFRSFIFFMPKREIHIHFEYRESLASLLDDKRSLLSYLENHFNSEGPEGEPIKHVPGTPWEKVIPKPMLEEERQIAEVPESVKEKVYTYLAQTTGYSKEKIEETQSLYRDLMMDSLDLSALLSFLTKEFSIDPITTKNLLTIYNTVNDVLLVADKLWKVKEELDVSEKNIRWLKNKVSESIKIPEGKTFPECFLKACDERGKQLIAWDPILGMKSYKQIKHLVLTLRKVVMEYPGKYIGILLPSSLLSYALVLACHLAGKVPVMFNWTLGGKVLDETKEMMNVQFILTSKRFLDELIEVDLGNIFSSLVLLDHLEFTKKVGYAFAAFKESMCSSKKLLECTFTEVPEEEDIAVVLFTSGSEGKPKAVPLTHKNLLSNQRSVVSRVLFNPQDTLLSCLPPFHSFGFSLTGLMPLLLGTPVVYCPKPTDTAFLLNSIKKGGCSFICLPPHFIKELLSFPHAKEMLASLRLIASGGDTLGAEMYTRVESLGGHIALIEGYGLTECSPVVTLNDVGSNEKGVGLPIPGVEIQIFCPYNLTPKIQREEGRVAIAGESVFQGYLGDSEDIGEFIKYEEKLWYLTGDLGFLDEEGCLHLSGRIKRFVKVGGEMLSLPAMEIALEDQLGQGFYDEPQFAICGVEELILYTIRDIDVHTANIALKKAGFSSLVKVDSVKKLPKIPINALGKVQYNQLD